MKINLLAVAIYFIVFQATAETKYTMEVLAGASQQKTTIGDSSPAGSDITFGVRGAYQLSKYFAFEISYIDYGSVENRKIPVDYEIQTTAINTGIKGLIPLGGDFSFVANLGVSTWDYEVSQSNHPLFNAGTVFTLDDSGTDLYYGVGLIYRFNESVFFSAEYTVIKTEPTLNVGDVALWGINLNLETEYTVANDVQSYTVSVGVKF